jgi:biopolymer transport protein ExbD
VIIPPRRAQRRARIEIVPLIDVIFFLLATFMMVSLSMIQNRGIRVQLPAAATGAPMERGEFASLTIAADGGIYFDRERVDLEGLDARLEALTATTPDPKVHIGGDERAQLGRAIAVLDRVRAHGISRVALETRARPADEPRR